MKKRKCDPAKYVKKCFLETHDSSLKGTIEDIKVFDSIIFVIEKSKLLIFNTSGNFFRKIDKQGKGPGEFIEITNFAFNRNNQCIYIHDENALKIIKNLFKFS